MKIFKPTKYLTIPQYQLWTIYCISVANCLNDAGTLRVRQSNYAGEDRIIMIPYNRKEVKSESEENLNISNVENMSRSEFSEALSKFDAYWTQKTNGEWNPENYKLKQNIHDVRQLALF